MSDEKKIKFANWAFLATMVINISVNIASIFIDFNFPSYAVEEIWFQLMLALPFIILLIVMNVQAEPGNKISYAQAVNMHKIKPPAVLLTLVLAIFIQPVLTFFNALSMVFTTSTTSASMLTITKGLPLWAAILLMAAMPAFFEESVYRGMLYRPLRAAHPWKAVVLTAFCFGLMHGNLNQFMYAFVMGIIFALVNEATGSILSSMLIHFVVNFLSTFNLYMLPYLYKYMQSMYNYMLENQGENAQYAETITMLEQTFGDMTQSADEWMSSMLSLSANTRLDLATVLATYLPSAVVGGFIAYFLFRTISKQCGTWNNVRHVFFGAENPIVEAETINTYGTEKDIPEEKEKGTPGLRVLTVPMMIAIAIGVMFMFLYETAKLLPEGTSLSEIFGLISRVL